MRTGPWAAARRVAMALAVVLPLAGCHATRHRTALPPQTPARQTVGTVSTQQATSSTPAPQPPSAQTVADRRLSTIGKRLPKDSISVAVLNTRTGATYHWGESGGMWTGSVYKLLTLEALLLERGRSGSWLSSYEIADITAMIEQSKNKAGYRMYLDAGGGAALAAAARRLGLRHTRIGISDPALSTSGARDGLVLLHWLITPGRLGARSRAFVLGLMRNVQLDQRWGVGVVADRGTRFANKNGWMQVDDDNGAGEDDDGRWLVNSLGIVRVDGQQLLISIFTRHNPDCYTGIHLVEKLARVIAPTVVSAT